MVASTWSWKIRSVKQAPAKDFSVLQDPETAADFDHAVEYKLNEQGCTRDSDPPDATTLHKYINTAILHAIDTVLPDVLRSPGIKREVSEETKALYEKREKWRDERRHNMTTCKDK